MSLRFSLYFLFTSSKITIYLPLVASLLLDSVPVIVALLFEQGSPEADVCPHAYDLDPKQYRNPLSHHLHLSFIDEILLDLSRIEADEIVTEASSNSRWDVIDSKPEGAFVFVFENSSVFVIVSVIENPDECDYYPDGRTKCE